jgi:hypothetical protein
VESETTLTPSSLLAGTALALAALVANIFTSLVFVSPFFFVLFLVTAQ